MDNRSLGDMIVVLEHLRSNDE